MASDVEEYIRHAAIARGINPDVAVAVANSEGMRNYVGDQGSSFGPYQLHYGGVARGGNSVSGLGDEFTKATGLDARDPKTWQAQVDFALDHARSGGWGPWHGWKGNPQAGIGKGNQMADDFLTDFDVAPTKDKAATAKTAPAKAAPDVPDFESDFEVSPSGNAARLYVSPKTSDQPIGVNDAVRAAATGIPVIGGLLNRADAATDAGLSYLLNPLFADKDQLKGSLSERYHNALAQQEGLDTSFTAQHPTANTALNVIGGVAGTIPAMMAAPALFGLGEGGLMANSALSGVTGAGIGAADSGVRSGGNLADIKSGALSGGVFGALAPGAGKIAGMGIGKLADLVAHTTPAARNVANILQDIGMTPKQAETSLSRMGPQATLADLDPALTTEAGGLASMGGKPTSVLKNAMKERASNVDNRVSELMDKQLGPAPDAEATVKNIQDEASAKASPFYNAGKQGDAMDVTPVLADINAQLPNASGGIKNLLTSVKGFLTNEVASKNNPVGLVVPKSDPAAILGARQALDDIMYNRDTGEAKLGPNAMRVAGDLRAKIDSIVKSNDNFAQGDAIVSQSKNVQRAFKQGQEIFSSNIRPVDLARMLKTMPSEEVQALKQGARSSIADVLQSSRRGEGPAAQGLFGRSTNNRANLNLLFPNGQEALDALHAEAMMRGTEQRVSQNSATAERRAVQEKYAPKAEHPIDAAAPILGEALGGGPGAAGLTALRMAYGGARRALSANALNKLTEGTARGLIAKGAEQRAFLKQVERAARTNASSNALVRRGVAAANLLTRSGRLFVTPYNQNNNQ